MSIKAAVLLLTIGFGLGWFCAGFFSETPGDPEDNIASSALSLDTKTDSKRILSSGGSNSPDRTRFTSKNVVSVSSPARSQLADEQAKQAASFNALLAAGEYTQALERLSRTRILDEAEFAQMRQSLLGFLNGLMNSGLDQSFTELTDLYLADYYNDTDVLLMLAEFNKRHAFYFEAVAVFDLADEYVYSIDSKTQVGAAFSSFLSEVDAYLRERDDWYRLSQIYLQAEIADLLNAEQRVRQAAIYLKNGDIYEGKDILERLASKGALNKQGKSILADLNSSKDKNIAAALSGSAAFSSGVPLSLVGNQFLIDVNLDPDQASVLLIDTGASMTTLSRNGFEKIRYSIDAHEIGSRMFSTANGLTKGQVYQVAEFGIGQYRLQNVELAVLDFDMSGGAEGLLGMNVLGRFKFQLDQEKPQLLLTPRNL